VIRRAVRAAGWQARRARGRASIAWATVAASIGRGADLAIFHEFQPAPAGGGHQFLRGLERELRGRGLRVEHNRISRRTPACLYNSFNFDFARLQAFARDDCRMVHRVDGPIGVYRGTDDDIDERIWEINARYAQATIFQSEYSLRKHLELGLEFCNPLVIRNAPDPAIFHPSPESRLHDRVRLISTSWSDNPNKGGEAIAWLDENLDPDAYELTFVGRSTRELRHARVIPPVPSEQVAELLRDHDVFVMPSRHEACSNALLEALACGLPAVYVDSGSNPELVGEAGLSFRDAAEIPALLERVVAEYDRFRGVISVPSLSATVDAYSAVLRGDV
jgi:glycosyltransferase involved in cell wall biosynthesis